MTIKIRAMKSDDITACSRIVRDNFDYVAAVRFEEQARQGYGSPKVLDGPQYWVALDGDTVVAFAGMRPSWIMQGVWEFIWINVAKNYRGRGIGRDLTEIRIASAIVQGATVINLMTRQPEFFEAFWFTKVRVYQPSGWWLMTKQLGSVSLAPF